jgi:hypothetical protein
VLRRSIRLPDLVTLLQAKIHNALSLDQQNRQDVKHARILALCNRAFLRHAIKEVEAGKVSERALIRALEALFTLVQGQTATEASRRFGIDWSVAFPVFELKKSTLERVSRFMQSFFASVP